MKFVGIKDMKYRAWDVTAGVMLPWEEFDLDKNYGDDYVMVGYGDKYGRCFDHEMVLMSATGFIDKKGKEVYTGDLLEVVSYHPINGFADSGGDIYICVDSVVYDEGIYMLDVSGMYLADIRRGRVVGNVYEGKK